MAIRSASFQSSKALVDFLVENAMGKEDILALSYNSSGWVEVIYDSADPTGAAAGAGATDIDLAEGARLRRIRVTASGGNTTLNILGLGSFTILDGDTFEIDWEGRYVGDGTAVAANRIAIGANSLYFVSWLDRSS